MSATEANLDDFFRKRDKKKNKSSKATKFSKIDTAELASHLEAVNSNNNLNDDEQPPVQQSDDFPSLGASSTIANQEPASDLPTVAATTTAPATITTIKTKLNDLNLNNATSNNDNGDEEWKPFDTDENKNYSGLKIGLLQQWQNDSDEENTQELNGELDKKPACPWSSKNLKFQANNVENSLNSNVIETSPTDNSAGANVNTSINVANSDDNNNKSDKTTSNVNNDDETSNLNENKTTSASAAAAKGAYVPPYLRNQQASEKPAASTTAASVVSSGAATGGSYIPPHLRNKSDNASSATSSGGDGFQAANKRSNKNQPNINDSFEFPSLSDVKPNVVPQAAEKFEQPKRAGKIDINTHNPKKNTIDLENKYNALSS